MFSTFLFSVCGNGTLDDNSGITVGLIFPILYKKFKFSVVL